MCIYTLIERIFDHIVRWFNADWCEYLSNGVTILILIKIISFPTQVQHKFSLFHMTAVVNFPKIRLLPAISSPSDFIDDGAGIVSLSKIFPKILPAAKRHNPNKRSSHLRCRLSLHWRWKDLLTILSSPNSNLSSKEFGLLYLEIGELRLCIRKFSGITFELATIYLIPQINDLPLSLSLWATQTVHVKPCIHTYIYIYISIKNLSRFKPPNNLTSIGEFSNMNRLNVELHLCTYVCIYYQTVSKYVSKLPLIGASVGSCLPLIKRFIECVISQGTVQLTVS